MTPSSPQGEPSLLDQIEEHNREFKKPAQDPSGAEAARGLCVVSCHDPRLTRLVPQALGLERGDAVLIRVPGAGLLPDSQDLLRQIAAAVYLNGCREVLILGHTDCAIHRVTVSAVIDAMSARGCPRDSVAGDVREFFGLRSDVRATVLETAQAMAAAPFLPADVQVHAAIIDTFTGALSVIERSLPRAAPAPAPGWLAPGPFSIDSSPREFEPMPGIAGADATPVPSAPPPAGAAGSSSDAAGIAGVVAAVRAFTMREFPESARKNLAKGVAKMMAAGRADSRVLLDAVCRPIRALAQPRDPVLGDLSRLESEFAHRAATETQEALYRVLGRL